MRLALLALALTAAPADARPNVVLIMVDDMGYADLGCYGCEDINTPHIDRLAAEGVRATDFYSNGPVCTPTRAGLMTGRYQQRVGLEWAIYPGEKKPGLEQKETCVARMLKDAGYATACVGKWHLGYKPEFGPNAHGFNYYYGLLSGNVDHYSHKESNGHFDWYENLKVSRDEGYSTDLISQKAVAWLKGHAGEPFFLYVPYNSVHWPFQPPDAPETVRTRKTWTVGSRKIYKAMLERIDDGVGQIMATLKQQGVSKNTLVIFTNDNGGERFSVNKPLARRKGQVWEGGIRVPCIFRWAGELPAGRVDRTPGMSMDLTATVLAACDVEPTRKLDGVNLLPVLKGEKALPPRPLFWRVELDRTKKPRREYAVRYGGWKYIQDDGKEFLFNLKNDIGEKNNLIKRNPAKADRLKAMLKKWNAEMDAARPRFRVR